MKKILIAGPFPEPTSGVSLANKILAENLIGKEKYEIHIVNTSIKSFEESLGQFSFSKFIKFLKINLKSIRVYSSDIIYITPGQTFFGILKYSGFFIFSKIFKKELIVHVHGNYLGYQYEILKGFKKIIFKKLLENTNKGIVLSESLVPNMLAFIPKDNIFIVKNFVEDFLFNSPRLSTSNGNEIKIIYLSNLMTEKGIFDLLDALEILETKNFGYQAKIAGNIDEC